MRPQPGSRRSPRADPTRARQRARSRDRGVRARLWWTQSRLHVLQNDSDRAERYARLALDVLLLTEHARYSAIAFHTLAHIKLDQGDAEEALDLLERGFPLVLESG